MVIFLFYIQTLFFAITRAICCFIFSGVLGYAGLSGNCICAEGYFGEVVYDGSSLSGCSPCVVGTWAMEGSSPYSSPIPCNQVGYSGDSGNCTCALGYSGSVKYVNGMLSGCSPISCSQQLGYTGSPGACECASGYSGSVTYIGSSTIGCNPIPCGILGYTGAPAACTCDVGYSGVVSYTGSIPVGCSPCPDGSWSIAGGNCVPVLCNSPGYSGVGGNCNCNPGLFSIRKFSFSESF
jgi:hypothetical protein